MGAPAKKHELAQLIDLASEIGVTLDVDQAQLLLAHLGAVLQSNTQFNLTSITTRDDAIRRHIIDSLAVVAQCSLGTGRIADLGSGAGYPGIPVAIAIRSPVDLIESRRKKATFLESCIKDLGGLSGSRALPLRAEEVALESPNRYSVVLARAVTSLPSLVELASPLLAEGGRLIAMKGVPTAQERAAGQAVARVVGMAEDDYRVYRLPGTGDTRTLVTYVKKGEPQVRLPRRAGLAQKRPLA